MCKELKKAMFVKSVKNGKVYLVSIDNIPDDVYYNLLDENDLYGMKCRFANKEGEVFDAYVVSNILRMSGSKLKNLAKELGGYYPLAPVIDFALVIDVNEDEKLEELRQEVYAMLHSLDSDEEEEC